MSLTNLTSTSTVPYFGFSNSTSLGEFIGAQVLRPIIESISSLFHSRVPIVGTMEVIDDFPSMLTSLSKTIPGDAPRVRQHVHSLFKALFEGTNIVQISSKTLPKEDGGFFQEVTVQLEKEYVHRPDANVCYFSYSGAMLKIPKTVVMELYPLSGNIKFREGPSEYDDGLIACDKHTQFLAKPTYRISRWVELIGGRVFNSGICILKDRDSGKRIANVFDSDSLEFSVRFLGTPKK